MVVASGISDSAMAQGSGLKATTVQRNFRAAYEAALKGEQAGRAPAARFGNLAWLIARYREVDAWRSLSPATRRQRENIFKEVLRSAGTSSYSEITKAVITAGRDRRAGTPAQARPPPGHAWALRVGCRGGAREAQSYVRR
jgi:hypothetical protein